MIFKNLIYGEHSDKYTTVSGMNLKQKTYVFFS